MDLLHASNTGAQSSDDELEPWSSKNAEKRESLELVPGVLTTPEAAEAVAELPPPPDGGMWAWMQVIAACICNFNSWGIVNSFGVYQDYYQKDLLKSHSPFQISWIVSLSGSLLLFATNFFGGLVDLGYMKHLALAASLLQFCALMLLSWSKTYAEIILTQGLFSGFVASVFFLISIVSVAPYFSKKRPLAIGLGATGSSLGGTMYSSIARKLLGEVGFGWSTRIIAFIQLAMCLVMFLCLKRRLPPNRKRKVFFAYECFKEADFMFYALGGTCGFIALYTFYVYFESYALVKKPQEYSFLYMTAILNAGSLIGRVLPAYLANFVGPFNVMIPAEACALAVAFCWICAENKGGIIAVAFIFGLFSGPLIGLPGAVVSSLTKDFNRLGIRLSFAFTFFSFGIVLGPPLAGIIERRYGWFWVQMYACLAWLGCMVCHIIARLCKTGFKLRVRA